MMADLTKEQIQAKFEQKKAERDEQEAIIAPIVEARVEAEVSKLTENVRVSAQRRRAMGIIEEQNETPDVVAFTFPNDPEPWYIARLDAEGFARCGMLCERDAKNQILIANKGQFGALLAAMFFVAVCEEDGTPLFESLPEARAMATKKTPKAIATNSYLFKSFLSVNPEIFPDNDRIKETLRQMEEDDFLEQSEKAAASSTS